MALTTRFDTPANIRDVAEGSPFYEAWHEFIKSSIVPAEVKGENDGAFYNPAVVDVNVLGEKMMVWMGFPRRVLLPNLRDDKEPAYQQTDVMRVNASHPQDEYFEWYVHKQNGKISKITFVTELRSYFEELWKIDPTAVVKIFRKHVNPGVVESDLQKPDGSYNVFNRWNTVDGIMHYTQGINTLDAAIGLAQDMGDASPPVLDNYDGQPTFAKTTTSVDPRVNYDVHMLVRKGLYVTFREPIGIYIVDWNNHGITRPDGKPAPPNWWKIRRGQAGMVLRLDYEVPKSAGFLVGDMTIGGQKIEYGGQLAEHISVGLAGVAGIKKEVV